MQQLPKRFTQAVAQNGSQTMRTRQEPLTQMYAKQPEHAWITDHAATRSTNVPASTALYTEVLPGSGPAYPIGVHKAVGGESDFPTPGDILCAAMASCLDSCIRIIASRLGVKLTALRVDVEANIDVRGTLRVDDAIPVGFQNITMRVDIAAEDQVTDQMLDIILTAAEYSCVVVQTLRNAPEITIERVGTSSARKSQQTTTAA
jgi:uncharacterized OsmC-like protein